MLNSFNGIGRLGGDPQVFKNEDQMVATFDIAINEFFRSNNEMQKKTHWIPCVAFGRMAELASEFLRKGSQIGVRGALKERQWNNGGNQRKTLQVHVAEMEFLSSRSAEEDRVKAEDPEEKEAGL